MTPNFFRFVRVDQPAASGGTWTYTGNTVIENERPPNTLSNRPQIGATALEESNALSMNHVRGGNFNTMDAYTRDDDGNLRLDYSITSSATVRHCQNDGASFNNPGLAPKHLEARYNPSQDSIWYLAVSHSTSADRTDFSDSTANLSMYRITKTDGRYADHEKLYDNSNVGYSSRGQDRQFHFLKSDCSEILARKNGEYDTFYILKSSTGDILQTIDLPNYDAGNLNDTWADERHSGIDVSTSRDRFVVRGELNTINEYGDQSNCIGLQVFKSASAGWELEHEKAIATVDTNNVAGSRWGRSDYHGDTGKAHFNTNITDDYIAISTPDYWDESNPSGNTRAINGMIAILKKTNGTDWSGGSEKVFFLQSTGAWSDLNDGDMSEYPFSYGNYGEMGQTLSMAPNGDFAFSDPSNLGGKRLWIYKKDTDTETWSFVTASAGNTTSTYHTEGESLYGVPLVVGNNYIISSEGTKSSSWTNTVAQTYAEYKKE